MKYTITITLRERERNRLLRIMQRKRMDRTALDRLGALVSQVLHRNPGKIEQMQSKEGY